ncbi:MAG: class I SAM-dependent methyltransferase [Aggregatilineales bacterium]
MSTRDRIRWDKIYQRRIRQDFPAPDPLMLQYTPAILENIRVDERDAPVFDDESLIPRALDLAAGVGQNGLWLAEQGYAVDIMDISRMALQRARTEMTIRNLRNVNLLQVDVDTHLLEIAYYDMICMFRYLDRDLFAGIRDAIKPGGRFIYASFNRNYLETVPDFNPDFLLEPGELRDFFPDWQHVLIEDVKHESRFVAVKPDF